MTQQHIFWSELLKPSTITQRALAGAIPAFIVIALFLMMPYTVDKDWSKYWMLRPLFIVPLAGAMGGLFYHFMDTCRKCNGWNRLLTISISVLVYIVGVWLGIIVGLDGTLWD